MKLWGDVSSFPGTNTIFEGQQINGQTRREETQKTVRRENTEKEITEQRAEERSKTQIKEDPSSISKEEPGPLRDTSEGQSTL
jgi:hypothetical protein